MCLIAAISPLVILQVALGLGMVIFVHELGHFAVAKMCGVKCEKFFIGFDIGGYKLSRQWGETEYGIGILPLGGYVKMLGQDDNPANIAEQVRESEVAGNTTIQTKEITGPDGEKYVIDSRSYLAKSVPQRMAIISAGVIMNVIFAVVFAAIAFGIGVPYAPCIVSQTVPGSAAYQAGIAVGDEITRIGEVVDPTFTDLRSGVMLGDLDEGIEFTVRRAETGSEETVILHPQQDQKLAQIGIFASFSLRLANEQPVAQGTPAASASAPFMGGDEIVAINGQPVDDYREYMAKSVRYADQPIEVTVRRGGKTPEDDLFGPLEGGEMVTLTVPARPRKRLGLVMEMGRIEAVQQGSAAAELKIQAGDFLEKVIANGDRASDAPTADNRFDDPIALPEQLRKLAEEAGGVRLTLRRSAGSGEGRQAPEQLDLSLRRVTWIDPSWVPNKPLSVPALGLAYRVLNRVARVEPGSPAAKAGLQGGDVITQAKVIAATKKQKVSDPIKFGSDGNQNWPSFVNLLQGLPEGAQVKISYRRGETTGEATLAPIAVEGSFVPERGFVFSQLKRLRTASSLGEQLRLGYDETVNSLGMVFRFLRKLGTQIPLTALGGPVTIAQAAGYSAAEGAGKLLIFLTMLSANLAVINFLPIPLLDGGHMVFLAWEGVRGRPASERFVVALHTVGFVFIISLMLFVLTLDVQRLLGLG